MSDFLKNPIIVFGAPRSGTTIISEVIFQHMDLAWPSNHQESFPTRPRINYLRRIFDNKYWRLIGKKKHSSNDSALLNKILFKPGENYRMWRYLVGDEVEFGRGFLLEEKASPERQAIIRKYFTHMVRAQGKKRIAFKVTGPPRMGYLLSIFPEPIFIHIKRAPIPTISSLLKVGFWQTTGKTRLWWTGPYSSEEERWAQENKDKPELITAIQLNKIYWAEREEILKYQPNILEVNYEDFTADPRLVTERMLDFCGLKLDTKISHYLENNPIVSKNRPDDSYFDEKLLKQIDGLLEQ